MTRKHFEAIALSLGLTLRNFERNTAQYAGAWAAAYNIAHDLSTTTNPQFASAANPRFDPVQFMAYVLDVYEGRRDLMGKKVAA